MTNARIGWFDLEEDFNNDGSIDVAIVDRRNMNMVSFELESLCEHSELIAYLESNQAVNVVQHFKAA